MTEEELRQWLAKYLLDNACEQDGDFDDMAYDIFAKFKQANYVRLADDQSLPETQIQTLRTDIIGLRDNEIRLAGFRKVEL